MLKTKQKSSFAFSAARTCFQDCLLSLAAAPSEKLNKPQKIENSAAGSLTHKVKSIQGCFNLHRPYPTPSYSLHPSDGILPVPTVQE